MDISNSKKNKNIWSIISLIIYTMVLIGLITGLYITYQNNQTKQIMAQSKLLDTNVAELMEKSLTLYTNRDTDDFLSRIATQETVSGFIEQADKLIERHQFLEEQVKKRQIKNYKAGEINELIAFNKQIKHHLEVRTDLNNLFESNYMDRNKANEAVAIKADLKRKEITNVKKKIKISNLSSKIKKEYLKGITIANSQIKQVEVAGKAVLTIYNKGEVVKGATRLGYESVVSEVDKIKSGTLKKTFERALIAVDNNLKAYEQKERKKAQGSDFEITDGGTIGSTSGNQSPNLDASEQSDKSVGGAQQQQEGTNKEQTEKADNAIVVSPKKTRYSPWFTSEDGKTLIKWGDNLFDSKEDALKWLNYYVTKYENQEIYSSDYGVKSWGE